MGLHFPETKPKVHYYNFSTGLCLITYHIFMENLHLWSTTCATSILDQVIP